MLQKALFIILFFLFQINTETIFASSRTSTSPKREFRGVWIATVSNIDWPSKPGLSTKKQKEELIQMLDMHQNNGFNAIIFQVRPSSDAFYKSKLEPWSKYLSGEQGKAPDPFYDPLSFVIEECHKRNMEFHAWCNPYRLKQSLSDSLNINHSILQHPEWIVEYGNKQYLDPANPEVRKHVTNVVADIVSRYDVDAIHFDDYFYPYKIKGQEFPDEKSFEKFKGDFDLSQKDEWRRNNVDMVIQMLSDTIKDVKPWVKFGISPFGVWRNKKDDPKGSLTNAMTNYDDLYADILKWLDKKWIDYVIPQLYWEFGHPAADFNILTNWWHNNANGRNLFIGLATYKTNKKSNKKAWRTSKQIIKQIKLTRNTHNIGGCSHYSSNHFKKRHLLRLSKKLQKKTYKSPALIPQMPWIDKIPPSAPLNVQVLGKNQISWEDYKTNDELNKTKGYIIYAAPKNKKLTTSNPKQILGITKQLSFQLPTRIFKKKYKIGVTAFDRLYNESKMSQTTIAIF